MLKVHPQDPNRFFKVDDSLISMIDDNVDVCEGYLYSYVECDVPALLAVESVSKAVMPLNQSTSGFAQNYSISNSTTSPSTPSSSVRKLSLSKNKKRSIPQSPVVDKSPLSSLPSLKTPALTDVNPQLSTPKSAVQRLSLSKNKKRFLPSASVVDGSIKPISQPPNPTSTKKHLKGSKRNAYSD